MSHSGSRDMGASLERGIIFAIAFRILFSSWAVWIARSHGSRLASAILRRALRRCSLRLALTVGQPVAEWLLGGQLLLVLTESQPVLDRLLGTHGGRIVAERRRLLLGRRRGARVRFRRPLFLKAERTHRRLLLLAALQMLALLAVHLFLVGPAPLPPLPVNLLDVRFIVFPSFF